ncbi:MAG: hypothetical protein AAFV88_02895 [Planctomycetota bacterium]
MPIGSQPSDVPSFGCVVYLRNSDGKVHGRVANLDGIEVVGADDRSVLGKIVQQFKRTVSERLAQDEPAGLLDPPAEKRSDERKLFLPVHL